MHHVGQIEVICGSMFCGKTEELIRRVRRAIIAKQTVQVFKPALDDRYGVQTINSHTGQQHHAIALDSASEILRRLDPETTVVAVDEIQFFDPSIVEVIETLANRRVRVICAGLDLDFRGEPFGSMPQILCRAEEVLKLHAICVVCGERASRTQRLVNNLPARYNDPVIFVGASESYEARCREHHIVIRD
ncbi:MAG: thymidine kinase [Anaerolineae bacterium]|nr:thymidine kinase [Anaerolineae bacterium]NUQ02559.1 thymidine kinase [Anaerolineae bacterium]